MSSRMLKRFMHFHHTHPEIYPLTLAVSIGSVVAIGFPIYSYCQNMEVGIGKDYTNQKKMNWYNYIFPTRRKHFSENEQEVESLRKELFSEVNKK